MAKISVLETELIDGSLMFAFWGVKKKRLRFNLKDDEDDCFQTICSVTETEKLCNINNDNNADLNEEENLEADRYLTFDGASGETGLVPDETVPPDKSGK